MPWTKIEMTFDTPNRKTVEAFCVLTDDRGAAVKRALREYPNNMLARLEKVLATVEPDPPDHSESMPLLKVNK